jgi:hypothetical protein
MRKLALVSALQLSNFWSNENNENHDDSSSDATVEQTIQTR